MAAVVGCRLRRPFSIALLTAVAALFLLVEPAAASVITVTTTDDSTTVDTFCSLREAIENANNNALTHADCLIPGQGGPTVDTIAFDIAGDGPHIISVSPDLPALRDPVTIDGLTEPSVTGGACPLPSGRLAVQIDAAGASFGLLVLIGSSGSTIRGLSITNFPQTGIRFSGSDNSSIRCNYLGVGADGVDDGSNGNGVGSICSAARTTPSAAWVVVTAT